MAFIEALAELVSRAKLGQLDTRIQAEFVDEEFQHLREQTNDLCGTIDANISNACQAMSQIASGDLKQIEMDGDVAGAFAELRSNIDMTAEKLREITAGIADTTLTIASPSESLAAAA